MNQQAEDCGKAIAEVSHEQRAARRCKIDPDDGRDIAGGERPSSD